MVGLSLANQLINHDITNRIIIIDKEMSLGVHTSGRNSGVLHAGLYYKPETTKARVCVNGHKRLREWILDRNLPINSCGKVVVPTKNELDSQLDVLMKRGVANGANVELWDEQQLKQMIPEARTASGRALWSPNTAVVKPKLIIQKLREELEEKGVSFRLNEKQWCRKSSDKAILHLSNGENLYFEHLFNCTGLHADQIAHQFNIGHQYSLLPFKGFYWQIKKKCSIQPKTNVYPVPDLSVPFLGVHLTPSADPQPTVSIGPTATPAWGREHYQGLQGVEPSLLLKNATILAKQYILNRGNFRRYTHEQAFLSMHPLLVRAAQELIPTLTSNDIETSQKVAIRSQLFNHNTQQLEDDFLCLEGPHSTHILNAISPAFTASFELADLILERSGFLPPQQ